MKSVTLTAAQQAEAKTLESSLTTAQAAFVESRKALETYLATAAGTKHRPGQRFELSDDGTQVIG